MWSDRRPVSKGKREGGKGEGQERTPEEGRERPKIPY